MRIFNREDDKFIEVTVSWRKPNQKDRPIIKSLVAPGSWNELMSNDTHPIHFGPENGQISVRATGNALFYL